VFAIQHKRFADVFQAITKIQQNGLQIQLVTKLIGEINLPWTIVTGFAKGVFHTYSLAGMVNIFGEW